MIDGRRLWGCNSRGWKLINEANITNRIERLMRIIQFAMKMEKLRMKFLLQRLINKACGNKMKKLYEKYLKKPWYNNTPSKYFDRKRIVNRFKEIFE